MPRRRKLKPEFEKLISICKKDVELITAKIHDIDEEDILEEYKEAFTPVLQQYLNLSEAYKTIGYNDDVQAIYDDYKSKINQFESEYEI